MKVQLNDKQVCLIKDISDFLKIDYESDIDKNNNIDTDTLLQIIRDLRDNGYKLEQELDNLEQEIEDYYEPKQIDDYEFNGVSRNDFI